MQGHVLPPIDERRQLQHGEGRGLPQLKQRIGGPSATPWCRAAAAIGSSEGSQAETETARLRILSFFMSIKTKGRFRSLSLSSSLVVVINRAPAKSTGGRICMAT
jgi:hypothetical protein